MARSFRLDCPYEQRGGLFVCPLCGDEQPQAVRRNCPEKMPFESMRVVDRIMAICRGCESFPCLGSNECRHENRLIKKSVTECPEGQWIQV